MKKLTILIALSLLMILLSAISDVSAGGFRAATEIARTVSNAVKAEENTEAIKRSAARDSGSSALSQTGGKTGTYEYKSGGAINEINIQELGGNKLRVKLYASYEYEINGNLNANVGEAKGVATLNGNTAVLVPEETENCEIALRFSGNKIIVKPKNEFKNCGFGLNVSAEGTYTKVSGKTDFGDSDENSTSARNSTGSQQNSKTERIRFVPGKSSTVISGKIIGGEEKIYLIGARAGQTIKVEITEGGRTDGGGNNDAVFHLVAPDGSYPMGMAGEMAEFDTSWSGKLKKTGDYKIIVGTIESKKVNFKMSVSIR
jgi:hypothetical protein